MAPDMTDLRFFQHYKGTEQYTFDRIHTLNFDLDLFPANDKHGTIHSPDAEQWQQAAALNHEGKLTFCGILCCEARMVNKLDD